MKIGEYTKIEFEPLDDLNTILEKLYTFRDKGIKVCVDYYGVMLFSDTVTENGAYLSLTGMTKEEFKQEINNEYEEEYKKMHLIK